MGEERGRERVTNESSKNKDFEYTYHEQSSVVSPAIPLSMNSVNAWHSPYYP